MPTGDLPTFVNLEVTRARPALFHQYPCRLTDGTPIGPTDFNPISGARFSGRTAIPPRHMFYAGDSRLCAQWECPPMRDLIGPVVSLSRRQFTHQRLVELVPQRDLQLVSLDVASLRRMVASSVDLDLLEELKQTTHHARTHPAAAAILALAEHMGIALDGLTWRSKQHGTGVVYLLFTPPASSGDLLVVPGSEIALDDPTQGWPAIDEALAHARMTRATADDADGDTLAADPAP